MSLAKLLYRLPVLSYLLILILIYPKFTHGQGIPQYHTKIGSHAVSGSIYYVDGQTDTPQRARKFQLICPDSLLTPQPVRGYIKNMYLFVRSGGPTAGVGTSGTAYNVEVKMGYTRRDTFKAMPALRYDIRDTFISGLTTVFKADSMVENFGVWSYWMKLPLMGDGFYYNATSEQNLVVEVAFGMPWVKGWIFFSDSSEGGNKNRLMFGYRDSMALQRHSGREQMIGTRPRLGFGFDLVPGPQAVKGLESAADLQLYPNPTKGAFRVSAVAAAPLHDVVITVRDVSGRQVLQKHIKRPAQPFSEEIDLSAAPPGTYLVELRAGDVRLSRSVTLE